ncbi:MAG: methylmalonyl Co-A mutase-associated GTPase MeaB [Blastocatellia bacterium]
MARLVSGEAGDQPTGGPTGGPMVTRIVGGEVRAIARVISAIEDGEKEVGSLLQALHPYGGKARTIGITGAPGAGKSSLVDKLALHYRAAGLRVAILAIDPSSPFSGGAILGDRIRMQALASDPQVFIRSMATRGALGGLSRGTIEAVAVLDAAGYDRILIETVGVGQDEVEVVKAADVAVVVLVPGMGDDIQAIKAGIMEIADLYVINKAEREGVERTERELLALLEMAERPDGWIPPIVRTVAIRNEGVEALAAAIDRHASFVGDTDPTRPAKRAKRQQITEQRILDLLRDRIVRQVLPTLLPGDRLASLASAVVSRQQDPYTIVDQLLASLPDHPLRPRWPREASPDQSQKIASNGRGEMKNGHVNQLSHLGIAVESMEEALHFWRDTLGFDLTGMETVEDQGVRVAFLPVGPDGGSRIELLEATSADTPVGRFLTRRGPGIHHLCLEVDDLAAMLDRLKAAGVPLLDEEPRRGAEGALVAFVHPRGTGGILLELTQPQMASPSPGSS